MNKMRNFPKIHSPFVREKTKKGYFVTKKIDPDYSWVFKEKDVIATDKIDGTNVGVRIEKGNITRVFNRETEKFIFNINQGKWEGACMEGISKAIQRGWLKNMEGDVYGELIGEIFNGNRHQITGHLFVPFEYLKEKCSWHSWVQNKYPKDFDTINEWFKELPSLFNKKLGLSDINAEGIVFYRPNGDMAKLRRDMYDWYSGEKH